MPGPAQACARLDLVGERGAAQVAQEGARLRHRPAVDRAGVARQVERQPAGARMAANSVLPPSVGMRRAGARRLGAAARARVRHRHAALPELRRRRTRDPRGDRAAAGSENPAAPGAGSAAPARLSHRRRLRRQRPARGGAARRVKQYRRTPGQPSGRARQPLIPDPAGTFETPVRINEWPASRVAEPSTARAPSAPSGTARYRVARQRCAACRWRGCSGDRGATGRGWSITGGLPARRVLPSASGNRRATASGQPD